MAKVFQVDTDSTLTTSLVSYWKLEDVNDFFGSNNGTASNVTFVAGKVNDAGTFAIPSPSTIDFGQDSSLDAGTGDFSVSLWVFIDSFPGTYQGIVSKKNTTGWALYAEPTSGKLQAFIHDGTTQVGTLGTTVLSSSTWYHLVYSVDRTGDTQTLYINNAAADFSGDISALTGSVTVAFGQRLGSGDGDSQYLGGDVDEVGLWTKILSAQERTDLYNGGSGQTMIEIITFIPKAIIF